MVEFRFCKKICVYSIGNRQVFIGIQFSIFFFQEGAPSPTVLKNSFFVIRILLTSISLDNPNKGLKIIFLPWVQFFLLKNLFVRLIRTTVCILFVIVIKLTWIITRRSIMDRFGFVFFSKLFFNKICPIFVKQFLISVDFGIFLILALVSLSFFNKKINTSKRHPSVVYTYIVKVFVTKNVLNGFLFF